MSWRYSVRPSSWESQLAATILLTSLCTLATANELTADMLASIRDVSEPAMSPNGEFVAYVVDATPRLRSTQNKDIWIIGIDGESPSEPLIESNGPDVSPAWSPDGSRLAYLSTAGGTRRNVYVVDPDDKTSRRLTPPQVDVKAYRWSPMGRRIAFIAAGLWIVDIESGLVTRAGGAGESVLDLAWSPDGTRIAVNDDNQLTIIDAATGERNAVLADRISKPWSRRNIFDWSPDGQSILYAALASEKVSPAGIGFWLSTINVNSGRTEALLKDYPGTVTKAVWASDSRHVIVQSFEGTKSRIQKVNVQNESMEVLVDDIFEEKTFAVARDGRSLVYLSSTFDSPVDVWYRDGNGGTRRLTETNPRISGADRGEVRELQWKGAHGNSLYGVVVLPVGYDPAKAYPLVVQLHGGPHFAWWRGWLGSWHDWAQLLANHGYAVFLPNPRGSTGQGLQFSLGNVNDIAHGPLEDVMRGVDRLVGEGVADSDRIGVGGWSYGGYLTAWAITQTGRFKAAVVGAGISRTTKRSDMLLKEYYGNIDVRQRYGHLQKVSPDRFLENVTAPTLVIHGMNDGKISYTQAVELHDGLTELGIETKLLLYPEEGHGIDAFENRVDMLENILAWYDRYLKH